MHRLKDTLLVGLGIISVVLAAEAGIRIVESELPDPAVWPSVEAHIKGEQLLSGAAATNVLFVGSSMTEAAVDPLALQSINPKLTAYNAALPFSNPGSMEYWLQAVALPGIRPDVVIYGIAPWPERDDQGRDRFLSGLQGAVQRRALIGEMSHFSVLLGNVGLLADWQERAGVAKLRDTGVWTESGHQTLYYARTGPEMGGKHGVAEEPVMGHQQAEAMRRTIRQLQADGLRVVLMIEPGRVASVDRRLVDTYVASLRATGRELDIEVWDTYSMGWPAEMYADGVHFNRTGTAAFTAYVAGLLENLDPLGGDMAAASLDASPTR